MEIKRKMAMVMAIGVLGLAMPSLLHGGSNTAVTSATATVSGSNSMDLQLFNLADDQPSTKVQFLNTAGITKANQYLKVEFDSNALGAHIIIRTDNRGSNPPFTGSGEGAGLVGTTDSTQTVPLLWVIFPNLPSAKSFQFTGDTDPDGTGVGSLPGATARAAGQAEGLVVDKANPNFETSEVQDYTTAIVPSGTDGLLGNFPTDEDGAGPSTGLRRATSPVFIVLGVDFVNANVQSYTTTTLGLDLVVQ